MVTVDVIWGRSEGGGAKKMKNVKMRAFNAKCQTCSLSNKWYLRALANHSYLDKVFISVQGYHQWEIFAPCKFCLIERQHYI